MHNKHSLGDNEHQMISGDSFGTHQAVEHRRWVEALKHRWPTALGIAVAAVVAFDLDVTTGFVSSLSALTVIMALVYLGAAALGQRRFAWPVFLAGFVALVVLRFFSAGFALTLAFLAAGLGFLVLGVARRQLRKRNGLPLQTVGMLIFGALALLALSVNTTLGAYVIAIALLGHVAWDTIHLRRNQVVTRSYAEFCAVVDLLLGTAILVMV